MELCILFLLSGHRLDGELAGIFQIRHLAARRSTFGNIDIGGRRVYTDPGQAALKAAAEDTDDDPYNVRIQLPGAGTAGANLRFSFKAIIGKFKDVPGQVDGTVDFSASAAISGAVTQSTYA